MGSAGLEIESCRGCRKLALVQRKRGNKATTVNERTEVVYIAGLYRVYQEVETAEIEQKTMINMVNSN